MVFEVRKILCFNLNFEIKFNIAELIIAVFVLFTFVFTPELLPSGEIDLPDSLSARLNDPALETKIKAYSDVMYFYNRVMPQKAIEYGEKALQIAKTGKYQKGEAEILFLMGVCCHAQSNYPKAMEYYQLSYEINKELKDNVGIGKCLNRIGLIYNVRGNYENALDYCLQSVSMLENADDKKALGESYNHLGIIYYILGDIPKAKEICFKALDFCQTINEPLVLAVSHEHLGVIFIKTKEFDKALEHVQKSLELRKTMNDRVGIAGSYENMAIIYRSTKRYIPALEYYTKSLELKKEMNNLRGMASSISGIGVTYFKMEEYEKSIKYISQAYDIRKQLDDKRGMVASLNQLAETYTAMKNYKSALEYYKLAKIYSDSLLNEQKNKAIAEFQEAFQHERRNKEILLLQRENTIQKYLRNFLLIISLLLTAIAVVIFIAYRSKRKVNAILINHNEEVTKQKEELQGLNEKLKELIATRDKFFSIIAHDLRSPFQGFLGLTRIIAEDAINLTATELSQMGRDMHRTANNLFSLLKNLLEWAQMQRGSFNFQPEDFLLFNTIYENIEIIKKRSEQKNISVINLAPDYLYVRADEKMVSSVFLNLLSNAVKFTMHNGTVKIDAVSTKDQMVIVSISDTGIGMPPQVTENLFKVGEKIGTKGTDGELSTGLGLLLCKEFIDKHNGKIWVESQPGIGSTFYFTLPSANNYN